MSESPGNNEVFALLHVAYIAYTVQAFPAQLRSHTVILQLGLMSRQRTNERFLRNGPEDVTAKAFTTRHYDRRMDDEWCCYSNESSPKMEVRLYLCFDRPVPFLRYDVPTRPLTKCIVTDGR